MCFRMIYDQMGEYCIWIQLSNGHFPIIFTNTAESCEYSAGTKKKHHGSKMKLLAHKYKKKT